MKTPHFQFLTVPRLMIGAAVALAMALLLAFPFLIPRLTPAAVRAGTVSDFGANPSTNATGTSAGNSAGDFEPQSRHYSAGVNHKIAKPSPAKLKKPKIQSTSAGN